MAQDKSQKLVPLLKDYHFSEVTGFILPEPLVELPEYFEPWNKLNRELADLIKTHKLRAAVDQLPELDASLLSGYRQLRLAYTILAFVSNGYIWQGEDKILNVLPRQLAVPWYAISQRLRMRPCVCFTAMVLSNCTRLDPSKPLALGNMKIICQASNEEPFHWFLNILAQSELDSVVGVKAVLAAMEAVLKNDIESVCSSLEVLSSTFHTLKTTMVRVHEGLPGDYFVSKIAPFLSGYGGKGTKFPEGIIFEGACDTPITAVGGSAAQGSAIQIFDVGLGLDHGSAQKYLNELRTYMPPAHQDFIKAVAEGPSIKDYVASSDDVRLKKLYTDCISVIRDYRSYHIQVVTKYVVGPLSRKNSGDAPKEQEPGANGGLIPFLKCVRDTSASSI